MNSHVQAPVTEMVWIELGGEFGKDARKMAMVVWASHGLKSMEAAFRSLLASFIEFMEHEPCCSDPDLWINSEIHSYEKMLCCYKMQKVCSSAHMRIFHSS